MPCVLRQRCTSTRRCRVYYESAARAREGDVCIARALHEHEKVACELRERCTSTRVCGVNCESAARACDGDEMTRCELLERCTGMRW